MASCQSQLVDFLHNIFLENNYDVTVFEDRIVNLSYQRYLRKIVARYKNKTIDMVQFIDYVSFLVSCIFNLHLEDTDIIFKYEFLNNFNWFVFDQSNY